MSADLLDLWLSGAVRRWHCNPVISGSGQTLADHQGRCAQLVLALWPDASMALVYAALHHDVGEYLAGDLSADFKKWADPAVIDAHAAVEAQARDKICGRAWPDLTEDEALALKLVDRLEALIFARIHHPAEFDRAISGWLKAQDRVVQMARQLGVGDAVDILLRRLTVGDW